MKIGPVLPADVSQAVAVRRDGKMPGLWAKGRANTLGVKMAEDV